MRDWFKVALQINQDHPDTWSLIGNLHLNKNELGAGQKKFERILKFNEDDTYATIAIGNIWLETLYVPGRDKKKDKRHESRALDIFKQVLSVDPRNIWAANGVGCILAHKNLLNEARDIFAQVREATADFSDVWLNIAHILVEHKQYPRAIQMYENCIKKFYKYSNIEILLYWARALFKANRLQECKVILIKARHVAPYDKILRHNLSLVQQKLAKHTLEDSKYNLKQIETAIKDLEIAKMTFKWLSEHAHEEQTEFDIMYDFKAPGETEAGKCQDLLNQTTHHLSRARRLDEEEREVKRKQEHDREEQKQKLLNEQQKKEHELQQQKMVLSEKRAEFVKKAQTFTRNINYEEKEEKKSRKRSKKDEIDEFISSGDSDHEKSQDGNYNEEASTQIVIQKSKKNEKKASKSKTKRVKSNVDDFIDDSSNTGSAAGGSGAEAISNKKRKRNNSSNKLKRVKRTLDSDASGDDNDVNEEESNGSSVIKIKKKKKKNFGAESRNKKKKPLGKPQKSSNNSHFKSKEYISSSDDDDKTSEEAVEEESQNEEAKENPEEDDVEEGTAEEQEEEEEEEVEEEKQDAENEEEEEEEGEEENQDDEEIEEQQEEDQDEEDDE